MTNWRSGAEDLEPSAWQHTVAPCQLHCLTAVEEQVLVQGKLEPVEQAGCAIASGLTPLVVLVPEHALVDEQASV